MDVSCETSTNPMNIYNNLPVRHHHHDDVSQQRLLSQHHPYPHQTPLGQYDDDTSSSGHSEAVAMWEKDRQQSQNGNNEPSFYMVQDNITSHHPRQQHHYYYTDNVNSRTPSTAPLSLIYNNSLTSTTNRNFLETVESPLFIESTGNRHQQTNITTNKESLKHNDDRVSNTIYTKKSGIQCEQNYLNEFKDNGTQSCKNDVAMTDGDTPKKEDKEYVPQTMYDRKIYIYITSSSPFYTDKKADVTNHHTIDHISNGNQPSHKLPVATERRRQRRESHNAGNI